VGGRVAQGVQQRGRVGEQGPWRRRVVWFWFQFSFPSTHHIAPSPRPAHARHAGPSFLSRPGACLAEWGRARGRARPPPRLFLGADKLKKNACRALFLSRCLKLAARSHACAPLPAAPVNATGLPCLHVRVGARAARVPRPPRPTQTHVALPPPPNAVLGPLTAPPLLLSSPLRRPPSPTRPPRPGPPPPPARSRSPCRRGGRTRPPRQRPPWRARKSRPPPSMRPLWATASKRPCTPRPTRRAPPWRPPRRLPGPTAPWRWAAPWTP
jgi:hypothetical protein